MKFIAVLSFVYHFLNGLVSYINIHVPLSFDVAIYASIVVTITLSLYHVSCVFVFVYSTNVSLYHVWCVLVFCFCFCSVFLATTHNYNV